MSKKNNGVALVEKNFDLGPVLRLEVSRIRPCKDQPRKYFDQEALQDLGRSIKRRQRVPIMVKNIHDDSKYDYEVIDGERRLRAAKMVGLTHLLGWVKPVANEDEQFIDSVVSNLCRAGHSALEISDALSRLEAMGFSREEMADECGFSVGWVDQHLMLKRLEPSVLALMEPTRPKDNQLPFHLALRLVRLPPDEQRDVANEIMDKKMPVNHARMMIRERTHQPGGRDKKGPNKDRRIVTGFIRRLKDDSNLIVNMRDSAYMVMFGSRPEHEVKATIADVENSIMNLQRIIQKLKSAKGVPNVRLASSA